jgi:hypothetical protein
VDAHPRVEEEAVGVPFPSHIISHRCEWIKALHGRSHGRDEGIEAVSRGHFFHRFEDDAAQTASLVSFADDGEERGENGGRTSFFEVTKSMFESGVEARVGEIFHVPRKRDGVSRRDDFATFDDGDLELWKVGIKPRP